MGVHKQVRGAAVSVIVFAWGLGAGVWPQQCSEAGRERVLESAAVQEQQPAKDSQPVFRLPDEVIRQSREAAAAGLAKPFDLKKRRPRGLEDLSSPAAIARAVDAAIRDLDDPQKQHSAHAQLQYLGDASFDQVAAKVKSSSKRVVFLCCFLLRARGAKAVPVLAGFAKSPDENLRRAAIMMLSATMLPAAVPVLIAALEDSDSGVRVAAVQGLERLGDVRAIPPLRQLKADSIPEVDIQSVIQSLYSAKLHDEKGYYRWPAEVAALRQLCADATTLKGEQFGPAELQSLLTEFKSGNAYRRTLSLRALAELRARSVAPEILKASPDNQQFELLVKLDTPQMVDYLIAQLQSSDPIRRKRVVYSLGEGGRWAAPLLIALLDDSSLIKRNDRDAGLRWSPEKNAWQEPATWPDTHAAYTAFRSLVNRHGLPQSGVKQAAENVQRDLPIEIGRLKKWWTTHGQSFLSEKPVPDPELVFMLAGGRVS